MHPFANGHIDQVEIAWNETIDFEPGANTITMRVPEAQARDITLPCDLALGYGEQVFVTDSYDATTPNTVHAFQGAPFAQWMEGLTIELGPASTTASAVGHAERRHARHVSVHGRPL